MYITPITKIHSTYAEAKLYFTEGSGTPWSDDDNPLKISDLAQGTRNLVVGEPGIGKTLLLHEIQHLLDLEGCMTKFISLKHTNAIGLIDDFLIAETKGQKVLLLDALDE